MRIPGRVTPAILLVVGSLFLLGCKSAEERAEAHYQSAVALLEQGDVDRAIVELRNVFDLDGGHIDARRTMAKLQLERGNLRGAYRQQLHLAEMYPDDLDSRIELAVMAFLANEWDEVDRHGARVEELAPEDPRVKAITLVRDYRTAVNDDDATARSDLGRQAEAALEGQPDNVALRNIVMDNALREQDFQGALDQIDWLIANEPANTRYYTERLRVLAILGDFGAVEAQLRDMIEIFPDDPTNKSTLIRFYISRDNFDGAEAVLRDIAAKSAPGETDTTVDLIRFLAEFRDTETVRTEIEKAVSEQPDPVPFRIIEATLDFSVGNRSEAIEKLESVLAGLEPSEQSRDVRTTLAKMLLATGNEVGARSHVEEVLSEAPSHTEALKMQASWQIEADDTDSAIGGLRMVLDQSPKDADAMTLIAKAYARAGQPELAKDFLAEAVVASGNAPEETIRYAQLLIESKSFLPAEDILLAALRIAPSNADLLINLGQLYLEMEDYGRLQGVVAGLRRIGEDRTMQAANALEAERINQQKSFDEAITFLEGLAGEGDANLETKVTLIRAKLASGDQAGALALAEDLAENDPDNEALTGVLAVAHFANGNLDKASALYRGLLDVDPNRSQVWRSLSRLKLAQGDPEAARQVIDEGLGHMPEDPDLLWAKASFLEQDQDIDGAIEIYEKLYALNSDSVLVANNLASLLTSHRDDEASLDRAWVIARRLQDANAPAFKDTYGWLLHRRGNSADALPYLETAAQELQDATVLYHLSEVYVALERPEDAIMQLQKALEIAGPADTRPEVEQARLLLKELQEGAVTDK